MIVNPMFFKATRLFVGYKSFSIDFINQNSPMEPLTSFYPGTILMLIEVSNINWWVFFELQSASFIYFIRLKRDPGPENLFSLKRLK
jgi:hypothetical protein